MAVATYCFRLNNSWIKVCGKVEEKRGEKKIKRGGKKKKGRDPFKRYDRQMFGPLLQIYRNNDVVGHNKIVRDNCGFSSLLFFLFLTLIN